MTVDKPRLAALERALRQIAGFRVALEAAFPFPADIAAGMPDETILCRCEGVTAGEFRRRRARSTPTRSIAPRRSAAAAWGDARDASAGPPPPSCWPRR